MSEAALTASGEALGPPERLHPLYLLTGLGKSFKGAWGLVAAAAVLGSQERWGLIALIAAGLIVITVGSLLLHWLKLEYRVGPDELRIDSGFLSRTSRAIPFDRVTDVDLEQGPLHRLFGLARVRLETGAAAAAADEDGVLDTISLVRAEALREHIRARRGRPAMAAVDADAAEAAPLFAMDKARVATAGLFNFSLAVLAGLFGASQTIGDVIGFDPFRRRFWIDLLDQAGPIRELLIAHQFITIIGGTLLLILIGVGTGMIRTLLREHGFRLDRTETGLRRRRGLLTLTDVTIPVRRVQAAIVASGPIRRAFGWSEVKLQSLAKDGAKGDHVVAPLAKPEEAGAVLAALDWPAGPGDSPWRPVSRAHVTSFAAMMVPAALVAVGAAILFEPLVLLSVAGAGIAVGARWADWRNTRFALSGSTLFVETGWWRRRRSIVPLRKIQSVDLSQSFWSRVFGICALRLGVAGGSGFSAHEIPALSRDDAQTLRARLIASP